MVVAIGGAIVVRKKWIQLEASIEPVISESELALFRFNYESAWKQCVKFIWEGKLRVVEDTRPYEFLWEDIGKNEPGDTRISQWQVDSNYTQGCRIVVSWMEATK
jgi:hypothetical protein